MPSVIQELSGEDGALSRDHVLERVEDWKRRVSCLYDEIVSWVPDLSSDRDDSVEMFEEVMRSVDVTAESLPVLRLYDHHGQVAKIVPRGLWIIGANGVVTLFSVKGQSIIADRSDYFSPARWEISPALNRAQAERLSPRALRQALR